VRVLGPAAGETPLAGPKSPLGGPCLVVMRAPTARGCNVAAAPPRVHNVIIDGLEKVVPVWVPGAATARLVGGWGCFRVELVTRLCVLGCNRPGNTRQVPTPRARTVVASGPHPRDSYI
jgi:hypothetical protein